MDIIFATFDVDVPDEIIERVKKIAPTFTRGASKEMIRLMFASARKYHPACRCVILTDEKTAFPAMPADIEIIRYSLDIEKLTLSRTTAQLDFLKQTNGQSHVVFLDTDILIQGDLCPLFEKRFDVGVTYRPQFMPINGGLILINGKGWKAGYIFMERILGLMRDRYLEFQTWFGSQLALKEAFASPLMLTNEVVIVDHDWGMRVLLLPAEKYNFSTPDNVLMDGYYPDKVILHFDGPRKDFMVSYYDRYIHSD